MEATLKLANGDRLNLMRLVSTAKGAKGVSELAAEAGLPIPTASVYLRALNARGLISVVRAGPHVYYGTGSDRSLPTAVRPSVCTFATSKRLERSTNSDTSRLFESAKGSSSAYSADNPADRIQWAISSFWVV